jgi:hypothetical protein
MYLGLPVAFIAYQQGTQHNHDKRHKIRLVFITYLFQVADALRGKDSCGEVDFSSPLGAVVGVVLDIHVRSTLAAEVPGAGLT